MTKSPPSSRSKWQIQVKDEPQSPVFQTQADCVPRPLWMEEEERGSSFVFFESLRYLSATDVTPDFPQHGRHKGCFADAKP